ncbi:MAG TPA: enoyl-CoA hydratase/isomerase family protein [Pirellulaceae bacterium]|nr:enoyl-CoA hydratase/isomerase family protein [Pirellulaceae bacterium]
MSELLQLDINENVAALVLSRPGKRNALKRQTLAELGAAIDAILRTPGIRVVVLRGAGSVFCAGMDLEEMQQRATAPDSQDQWQLDSEIYCEALTKLYTLDVPTIAVVQGAAVAGGVGLVLACDTVLASQSAFFMLPEPMRGITAAMVTPLLIHRVGAGPAAHLLLSGRRWSAAEALQFGLCHQMVADDRLEESLRELVLSIQSGSPQALAITKRHLRNMSATDIPEQLRQSMQISAEARQTDDAREGLAAFLEKRLPSWQPAP